MDYFYAQVEERDDPALKGRPAAVCIQSSREGSQGAVATSNYPARALGVKSGMPCRAARNIAPECVLLPARRGYYESVSESIMDCLRGLCGAFEQVGVDEAYMDVTDRINRGGQLAAYAKKVKDEVYFRERLTCSVGAAPNKLLAKMASSYGKPDGLTIVAPEGVDEFIMDMPVTNLMGVGGKTGELLAGIGIRTVRELREKPLEDLKRLLGNSRGLMLHNASRGMDDSRVEERKKSQYGRLVSLKTDTRDSGVLEEALRKLSDDVASLLAASGKRCRTVSVTFVLEDFSVKTRARTLQAPAGSGEALFRASTSLLTGFLAETEPRIRRIGVTASKLDGERRQTSLGDY